jgi:hypothetical protein
MMVTLEIPDRLAEQLSRLPRETVSKQFVAAWAADAYRTGRFSSGKLAGLLGMERLALTQMLGAAGVYPGTSGDEVDADTAALDKLLGPVGE